MPGGDQITLIGYGSLMSGHGLSSLGGGGLRVENAFVVSLRNCRRGFGKLSRVADRLALDLDARGLPLEASRADLSAPAAEGVEGMALVVSAAEFRRLAAREGYDESAVPRLLEHAGREGADLGRLLARLLAEEGDDPVRYRERLFRLVGYTSPHYIPHPVRLDGDGAAIVFLAPGPGETGCGAVVSVRARTGITGFLTTTQAWRQKPNRFQMSYFLSCLLGGAHGINVRDLLPAEEENDGELRGWLRKELAGELALEVERFLSGTGLKRARYEENFGRAEDALDRGGLGRFLAGGR